MPTGSDRNSLGQYARVDIAVILNDDKVRYFVLRGAQARAPQLRALRDELVDNRIPFMEDPSFDVFSG